MFITRDLRKINEILVDPDDERKELRLARREAEFGGSCAVLCKEENLDALKNLEYLSMYHCKLEKLDKIGILKACLGFAALNLGRNCLKTLPMEFESLQSLRKLWIEDNELEEFPCALFGLRGLEVLRMCQNRGICRIPKEIVRMERLKELALERCGLVEIPDEVGELHDLESLLLQGNAIEELPESIRHLSRLSRLQVGSNRLKSLPDLPPNLQVLIANTNRLTSVRSSIASLPLKEINLAHNQIDALPQIVLRTWKHLLPEDLVHATEILLSHSPTKSEEPTSATPSSTTLKILRLDGNPCVQDPTTLFTGSSWSQPLVQKWAEDRKQQQEIQDAKRPRLEQ